MTVDRLLDTYAGLAFSVIDSVLDARGQFKPTKDWPKDARAYTAQADPQ